MPSASLSGTVLNVTGLTIGQQYAMALYCLYPGSTSYTQVARQPSSGTRAAATTTWTFNISSYVGNAGTYQFYVHIYAPGQSPQNSNTNVVTYTTQAPMVRVLVKNYLLGGTELTDGSYTGYVNGIFYITYSGTQYQTYSVTYEFQYFRMSSDGYQGVYKADKAITIEAGLELHAYYKIRIVPVAPTITGISATKNSVTISWTGNGGDGTTGYWTLFYRAATGAYVSYGNINSSPVTVSGLSPGTIYYFKVRHTVNGSYLDSSDVSITTKALIASFAWTANDSYYIAAGQPIRNITAMAWSNLINAIAACGGSTGGIYSASSGSRITANHFNSMADGISGLAGAGSVPSRVTAGQSKVQASLFLGLKDAINRAISYKNST